MKNRALVMILLMSVALTGCAGSTPSAAETAPVVEETTQAPPAEEPEETAPPEPEYPIKNEDGSFTYPFTFADEYFSADFAGIDVLDSTAEYPRERFEDVFMYSKGAYLDDPSVPPEFFDEWGYTCAAADCKIEDDPEFGFNCAFTRQPDGNAAFIISDKNYCMAVQWEKGQILYHLWDNELSIMLDRRRGDEDAQNTATKEILAHSDIMGADAKAFVDAFDEGLYDKVLSTLSDNVTAYSAVFRFDNGAMKAKNISEDTIGFEFYLPEKGRRVYEISVDKITGKVYGTIYRTPYPGEDFYAYPAGVEWDENGPVVKEDPYAGHPTFEPRVEEPKKEEKPKTEAPAEEEKPAEEKPAASTGVVIEEEEFAHGVIMSPKQGVIVNDEFAKGVISSLTAQLDGMGASASSDPSSLIFRRKPFRFGTSAEEAANAMINDVMPMYGFDFTGKNYCIGVVEKFDNGYVVSVGWTRWN